MKLVSHWCFWGLFEFEWQALTIFKANGVSGNLIIFCYIPVMLQLRITFFVLMVLCIC